LNNKGSTPLNVDVDAIDDRLRLLAFFDEATGYEKIRSKGIRKFPFLSTRLYYSFNCYTTRDISRFLVYKDKNGKSQVQLENRGTFDCAYPLRLSYKIVDSYIGKLRAIFHAIGRDGEWGRRLGLGNPAEDKSVKHYLRLFAAE